MWRSTPVILATQEESSRREARDQRVEGFRSGKQKLREGNGKSGNSRRGQRGVSGNCMKSHQETCVVLK